MHNPWGYSPRSGSKEADIIDPLIERSLWQMVDLMSMRRTRRDTRSLRTVAGFRVGHGVVRVFAQTSRFALK